MARADTITIDDIGYEDVLVLKTGALYYVQLPDEGRVITVSPSAVDESSVTIIDDPYYRDALKERYDAARKANEDQETRPVRKNGSRFGQFSGLRNTDSERSGARIQRPSTPLEKVERNEFVDTQPNGWEDNGDVGSSGMLTDFDDVDADWGDNWGDDWGDESWDSESTFDDDWESVEGRSFLPILFFPTAAFCVIAVIWVLAARAGMETHRTLKLVTALCESVLAIPIFGGLIVISLLWTPLMFMFFFHAAALVVSIREEEVKYGSVVGMVASVIGFVPLVGMMMHMIASLTLWISFGKAA